QNRSDRFGVRPVVARWWVVREMGVGGRDGQFHRVSTAGKGPPRSLGCRNRKLAGITHGDWQNFSMR
ncbi:MAG: hypothetical protein KDI50_02890, partial [Candidatus Competibacteraceae bacterium]|nr:hypothetical protein [Candidatus Competibacteraceae bacterium]